MSLFPNRFRTQQTNFKTSKGEQTILQKGIFSVVVRGMNGKIGSRRMGRYMGRKMGRKTLQNVAKLNLLTRKKTKLLLLLKIDFNSFKVTLIVFSKRTVNFRLLLMLFSVSQCVGYKKVCHQKIAIIISKWANIFSLCNNNYGVNKKIG